MNRLGWVSLPPALERFSSPKLFEAALRDRLPPTLQETPLRFDVARVSYRPESAATKNYLYQPETNAVVPLLQDPILRQSPKSIRVCRVYGRSREGVNEIVAAFNALVDRNIDELTNV